MLPLSLGLFPLHLGNELMDFDSISLSLLLLLFHCFCFCLLLLLLRGVCCLSGWQHYPPPPYEPAPGSTPALISAGKDSRDVFSCSSHVRQFSHPIFAHCGVAVPPKGSAPHEQQRSCLRSALFSRGIDGFLCSLPLSPAWIGRGWI